MTDNYYRSGGNSYRSSKRRPIYLMRNVQFWHNRIKEEIMSKHVGKTIILDLGSGKLNDLLNWKPNFIIHAVEIDKFSIIRGDRKYKEHKNKFNLPKVYQYECDVTSKRIFDVLPKSLKVDHIYCNFSFHYFISNMLHIINIIKRYLKSPSGSGSPKAGTFNIVCFDGSIIDDMLENNNGYYEIGNKRDGNLLCAIRRLRENKISVKILSIGKWHDENLVFPGEITKTFKTHGLERVDWKNFTEFEHLRVVNKYTKKEIKDFKLNDDELEFSQLHMYLSFKLS